VPARNLACPDVEELSATAADSAMGLFFLSITPSGKVGAAAFHGNGTASTTDIHPGRGNLR